MTPFYRICLFGETRHFDSVIKASLSAQLAEFKLAIDKGVELQLGTATAFTGDNVATVGVYFGEAPPKPYLKPTALQDHNPIIPVVSNLKNCGNELPAEVQSLNAVARKGANYGDIIAASILESLGLVATRRRVFLSYRRWESSAIALQLFNHLSAKQFRVFLDTHVIRPGKPFQDVLWHQMCDSDILLMLDTPYYFNSTWTTKEFGKANTHKIPILRIGFPNVLRSKSFSVTESIPLKPKNFSADKLFGQGTLNKIAGAVERLRSKSVAVRQAHLVGSLKTAVDALGGSVSGPGRYRRLEVCFPNKKSMTVYPVIGVPTSEQVQLVAEDAKKGEFAIIYDRLGILNSWQTHMEWMGMQVDQFRWLKSDASDGALKAFAK